MKNTLLQLFKKQSKYTQLIIALISWLIIFSLVLALSIHCIQNGYTVGKGSIKYYPGEWKFIFDVYLMPLVVLFGIFPLSIPMYREMKKRKQDKLKKDTQSKKTSLD